MSISSFNYVSCCKDWLACWMAGQYWLYAADRQRVKLLCSNFVRFDLTVLLIEYLF
jgi:hypothetical protein